MYTHSYFAPALAALPIISTLLSQAVASPLLDDVLKTIKTDTSDLTNTASTDFNNLTNDGSNVAADVDSTTTNILPDTPIDSLDEVNSVIEGIQTELKDVDEIFATYAGLFQAIVNTSVPDSIPDAIQQAGNLLSNISTGDTIVNLAQAILDGVSVQDLEQNVIGAYIGPINSYDNYGNPPTPYNIYPKSSADAPYSVPEAQLRAAVYFPPGFQFGNGSKQPILFVPGTGAFGGVNFDPNLAKLFAATGEFDPVYLNVPGAMYNDTQINSEYVAYAMNYVYAVSNNKQIGVIAWSQGNPDAQWAYQYWPSTRSTTTDFISASADFHGTVLAYLIAPGFPEIPEPPSVYQQEYDANFIATLRAGGGDQPYVPSTSVWSITDEIVQPQYNPVASASYNGNANCPGASFTNNQIQSICPGLPAGGIYTHQGVLYNPLTFALAYDALTHDGPGQVSRLNLTKLCNEVVADGLSLADVLVTEGLIPLAAVNLFLYPQKVLAEPAIMTYALNKPVSKNCYPASNGSTNNTSGTNRTTISGSYGAGKRSHWAKRDDTSLLSELDSALANSNTDKPLDLDLLGDDMTKREPSNSNQYLSGANIAPIDPDSLRPKKRSNSNQYLGSAPTIAPIDLDSLSHTKRTPVNGLLDGENLALPDLNGIGSGESLSGPDLGVTKDINM